MTIQKTNILRLPEVIAKTGISRASIYVLISRGQFPKQISITSRCKGWLEHEVEAWLQDRIELSRSNGQ